MHNSNQKFGERVLHKRIKKRTNTTGILQRGVRYTSVHATSRPWHTSTAGIHMSVNKLGQIAQQAGPKAVKYLNQMRLSDLAQKPRGRSADPSTLDRNGRDSVYALNKRMTSKRANMAPGEDTVRRWQKSMTDERANIETKVGAHLKGLDLQEGEVGRALRDITSAKPSVRRELPNHYLKQYRAISGRITDLKKMKPRKYW